MRPCICALFRLSGMNVLFAGKTLNIVGVVVGIALLAALSTRALTDGMPSPIAGEAKDLASIFNARSPGPRSSALLDKLKRGKKPLIRSYVASRTRKPVAPVRLVNAPAFDTVRPPASDGRLIDSPELITAFAAPTLNLFTATPDLGPVAPVFAGGGGGGGGFVAVPGGGGGGGGGGGATPIGGGTDTGVVPSTPVPVPVPVPVPDVVSAIPEPESWAMMILGFGAIGAALRGQRRSAKLA